MLTKILFVQSFIFASIAIVTAAKAEAPSTEQASAAIAVARAGNPNAGAGPKLEKILGCVPAFKKPAGTWVCPLVKAGDSEPMPIAFVLKNGTWKALQDDISPACPPPKEAESAIRSLRKDPSLRITGSVDEGEGIFTGDRGIIRDKRGAYRIMCRYAVTTQSGKWLYVAYAWHEGGRYVIDPDLEIWDD